MNMIPSPSARTTTSTTTSTTVEPGHVRRAASLDDAASHLDHAQGIVMELWRSGLPDLDGNRAATLVAAHRAITEALGMLERSSLRRYAAPELLG